MARRETEDEFLAMSAARGGYLGHFERTAIPCERCDVEGKRTNSGEIPTLRRAADGRLLCMVHDF